MNTKGSERAMSDYDETEPSSDEEDSEVEERDGKKRPAR